MHKAQDSLKIPPVTNVTNEDIKQVFDLLAQGEVKLNAELKLENVTLVLGNTGSGKSTLTQRIAGYDNQLVSVEEGLDFTISKLNNNTHTSYVTSATIFPELVVDNSTGAGYYDFPGFLDTRGMAHDVVTSYFIKRVIDNVKRVKILFLVSYPSLTNKGTRDDFTNLLRHITKFIKNIDKLKDGIALIVTKVQYPQTSDGQIIQSIVNTLEKVEQELKKQADNYDAIKLIDVLLLQVQGTYPKISISRSPNQTGLLSTIPLVRENKQTIKSMIEKLSFVEKSSFDFGYFVPNQSLYDVSKVMDQINERILRSTEKSENEMQKFFIGNEGKINDLFQLCIETDSIYNKLVNLKKTANSHTEPKNCVQEIVNGVAFMNSNPVKQSLSSAIQYSHYSLFLHTVSNYATNDSFKCGEGLNNIIEYSDKSKKWYNYLKELYNRLLEYDVQQNTSNNVCTDLANHIAQHKTHVKSSASLLPFLEKCFPKYNHRLNDITNVLLDEPKLNTLHRILHMALKYDLQYSCDSNKLTVKGNYVKLSDIFKSNCTSAHIIEIFALNRLFLDTDLDMTGNGIQLIVIAPTWESWGARKIILDGKAAEANDSPKAQSGIIPEENGRDGKPGLPGTSGGSFVGIGETVINLQQLTISVNGGQGGPGQDGGDGAYGRSGEDAYSDIDESRSCSCICDSTTSRNHEIIYNQPVSGGREYILAGKRGNTGGSGGNGGEGGVGGYPGDVTFNFLSSSNTTKVQIEMKTGHKGADGKGGKGGHGGEFGRNLHIFSPCSRFFYSHRYKVVLSGKEAPAGKSGANGRNSAQIKFPKQTESIPKSDAINHYKTYIRENLNDSVQESYLRKFLDHLENNKHIHNNFYKTRGYLDDFKNLEGQYYRLIDSGSTNVLPFYQSLLNRVETYTSNNINQPNFKDHKALHYLSMAILSRICNIEYDLDNYQVVDINGYFPLVEKHIEEYKKQLNEIQINTMKKQYENVINTQISKASNLIEQSITPEINKIRQQIDDQIPSLILDVQEQEKQAKTNKKVLIQKQLELAKQLPLKAVLKMLNVASSCLGLLGAHGKLAASAVQLLTNQAGKSLQEDENEATSLIESARKANDRITTIYQQEQHLLGEILQSELIENASKQASAENDEKFNEISTEISSFTSLLHRSAIAEKTYNGIKSIIKDKLSSYLNELEMKKAELPNDTKNNQTIEDIESKIMRTTVIQSEMKKTELPNDTKNNQTIEDIESKIKWTTLVQSTISVTEVITDPHPELQASKEIVSALGDSVHLVQQQINVIKAYENDIKTIFIPRISNNQETLSETLQNSYNKSHAVLDYDTWKMQGFLKKFHVEMKTIVEISTDPSIKNTLMRCIDELSGEMMVAFQIFDRIQDYKDRVKFAKYVADLNSGLIMTDYGEFKQDIDDLELTIKSNLVLQEYEKALDTFKQYIFPFSNKYLNQFDISSFLRPTNLTDVISKAAKEVSVLRDMLTKKHTSVTSENDLVFQDLRYDITNIDQKPFFTWKNETYKEEIRKLLQGQEITLKADITRGIIQNAVKFKEIGIRFKLANRTMQNHLDQEAANFLVKLTHSGDSHYRCNQEYFIFKHNAITMQHSVNMGNNSHYHHMDRNSKLIQANEPLFSPYATWKIQLDKRSQGEEEQSTNSSIFDVFRQFFNQTIDLVLEGYGGHVSYPAEVCNDDLEKYYTLDEIISESYLYSGTQPTLKPRRKREYVTNGSEHTHLEDEQYVKSSANVIKSPINSAIRFISGILGHWKPIHIPNAINYNSIRESVQSLFGALAPFNIYTTKDYDTYVGKAATFSVYESLTLIDFFVRWVTKVKPYDNTIDGSVNSSEITASVLNIIAKLDEILSDLSIQCNLQTELLEYDPILLMSRLEKEVINGNNEKIREIIFNTIMDSFHYPNNAQFCHLTAHKINEVGT
ncbi:uncharacterized protein LOC135837485 [Planococcus citri]|uniref:uncharacterized protein LOC135837485 n=1 Tax=Planococcus citri TaxID=170843 RepID=UPI0031F9AEC0